MQRDDDDATWKDDLLVEVVRAFVVRAVSGAAVAEVDLPHIVVCRDPETRTTSYSGPFPTAVDALVAAEREGAEDRRVGAGPPMEFSVAALFPVGG